MDSIIAKIGELGQSIWYDNIRRGLITSGELRTLIDAGVTGITSNPTIFKKAIADSDDYQADLARLAKSVSQHRCGTGFPAGHDRLDNLSHSSGIGSKEGLDAMAIYEALAFEDIRRACDLFQPVHEQTERRDGFVSIEVRPELADDTEATIAEAKRIFADIGRPNVMIKIPATPAGLTAVEAVLANGINVNVTLIFSIEVYRSVVEAYLAGVDGFISGGGDPTRVASVASFFVSRVDTLVDKLLGAKIAAGRDDLMPLLGQAAVANTKIAYQAYRQGFGGERFAGLRSKGTRVQRPLWASTSTKNPEYQDLLYIDTLIGPDTVNTVPPATLEAMRDHGRAELTLERDLDAARDILERLKAADISMAAVTEQLKTEGVKAFADSFDELISAIEVKLAPV